MTLPAPARRTAFVLAGGGSFGAIQVGMLRALVAHGVTPDMVVGASVGAVNGAYFAGNPSAEGVAGLEAIWRRMRRQDVFPITWRTALGFMRRGDFLVSADGLTRLLDDNLPYRRLEEARIPIHVVATDMLSGGIAVFSKGPATPAIVASAAIPAAFAPVRIDSQYLVDGALTSNTPVRVAVEQGATRLIVLPTGFACALEAPPRGAVASALHALTLLISRQLAVEVESVQPAVEVRVVPPLCPLAGSAYDFSRTEELIERAAASTVQWIGDGGLGAYHLPCGLHVHWHGDGHDGHGH